MFTFILFRNAVKTAYFEKKSTEDLHAKMANPSPANLRDYCLIRLAHGIPIADRQVFEDYYNPTCKYPNLEKAILHADLGRLKSLQHFIIGKTKDPDETIVKLLAILINFEPRPYSVRYWQDVHKAQQEKKPAREIPANLSLDLVKEEVPNSAKNDGSSLPIQSSVRLQKKRCQKSYLLETTGLLLLFALAHCMLHKRKQAQEKQ